jgi:hypothetical protein
LVFLVETVLDRNGGHQEQKGRSPGNIYSQVDELFKSRVSGGNVITNFWSISAFVAGATPLMFLMPSISINVVGATPLF